MVRARPVVLRLRQRESACGSNAAPILRETSFIAVRSQHRLACQRYWGAGIACLLVFVLVFLGPKLFSPGTPSTDLQPIPKRAVKPDHPHKGASKEVAANGGRCRYKYLR